MGVNQEGGEGGEGTKKLFVWVVSGGGFLGVVKKELLAEV
jgi:hypothetical protein